MKPVTTDDVFDLLDAYLTSAALGAAMELGLFWHLAEQPLDVPELAEKLGIPVNRCTSWLEILSSIGLVQPVSEGYAPTATARKTILNAYSRDTWAFLAEQSRMRFPLILDLAQHIRKPGSVWAAQGLKPPDYFAQIMESPDTARRFTRMLYEIHVPYADELATSLDMSGVNRLLDLGGGSGVVSLALLRRYADLCAVVLDIPNVCSAGREIAREIGGDDGIEDRITYQEADYVEDELPSGFDMVLECDAGPYSEALFCKIRAALNPAGRLVIVNHFVPAEGLIPPSCLFWAFADSLADPAAAYSPTSEIRARLTRAGFHVLSERTLTPSDVRRWSSDWVVIEARK